MEIDKAYAPTFVLYCMTSTVASIVDKKLVTQNEKDGDFGYDWLKTQLRRLRPLQDPRLEGRTRSSSSSAIRHYDKKPPLARVIYRHIKETATQRLLLEKGDVDVARNLGPQELDAVAKNPDIKIDKRRRRAPSIIWA